MEKKRNRKAIVITAVTMLIGVLLVLLGFFGDYILGLFDSNLDINNIEPEDLGRPVRMNIRVEYDDIGLPDKKTQVFQSDDGELVMLLLDLSALSEEDKDRYYASSYQHITITGTLRAMDDSEYGEVAESLYRLYDDYYYEKMNIDDKSDYDPSEVEFTLDDFHKVVMEPVIPYCFEVESIRSFEWLPFIPAGIAVFLVSLILEICFVFKLKKRIVLPVVFGLLIIVPVILLWNHIRTIMTVNKVSDGLYTMSNLECTDTKGLLGSGASDIDSLLGWILDNHLYGAPNIFDESNFGFGCAAFAAVTPEGDHLFGRNFDYIETDCLLVYSKPEGAYASIGLADLGVLGVGQTYPASPDSVAGKMVMVIMPYIVMDGMNDQGVGAGILQVTEGETHQDNGKPDLLVFCAVRAILDNCASVDEAITLLDSYDIHSDLEISYHLFITDKSGRYVVVEWLDGEMVAVDYPCCTNSIVAPGQYYNTGEPDDRLGKIEECLTPDLIITESEAMSLLEQVKNTGATEWSCVYDLDDLSVDICLDTDYDDVYTFGMNDPG